MKIKDIKQDEKVAKTWKEFRESFNRASGRFTLSGKNLNLQDTPDYPSDMKFGTYEIKSLKGFPKKCHGNLDLAHNPLTTLEGCPEVVNGFFSVTNTNITSLKGFPKEVGGTVDISFCKQLTRIGGLPKKLTGTVDAHGCAFTTLKDNTCEEVNHGTFVVSGNKITSLDGVPRKMLALRINNNAITSLKNIHKQIDYVHEIYMTQNPIKECILGLLLIDGLKKVTLDDKRVEEIINSRLPNNSQRQQAVIGVQSELLDLGLDALAEL